MQSQQLDSTRSPWDAAHLNAIELVVVVASVGLVQRGIVDQLVVRVDIDMVRCEVAAIVKWDLTCACLCHLCFFVVCGGRSFRLLLGLHIIDLIVFSWFFLDLGFASALLRRRLCRLGVIDSLVLGGLLLDFGFASALLGCSLRLLRLGFISLLVFGGVGVCLGSALLRCRFRLWRLSISFLVVDRLSFGSGLASALPRGGLLHLRF